MVLKIDIPVYEAGRAQAPCSGSAGGGMRGMVPLEMAGVVSRPFSPPNAIPDISGAGSPECAGSVGPGIIGNCICQGTPGGDRTENRQ